MGDNKEMKETSKPDQESTFYISNPNRISIMSVESLTTHAIKITLPLEMYWEPKEDITTYELAQCMPFIQYRNIMPGYLDVNKPYMRHFRIINPNN